MARPRKTGKREPNGQLQRVTTQAALNAIEREKSRAVMSVAASNPDRRHCPDPFHEDAGTALNRFVVAYKLKREMITAGNRFLWEENRWRLAVKLPTICFTGNGVKSVPAKEPTTPQEMAEAKAKNAGLLRDIKASMDAIRTAGIHALGAVDSLAIGNTIPAMEHHAAAKDGLYALAVHYGLIEVRR